MLSLTEIDGGFHVSVSSRLPSSALRLLGLVVQPMQRAFGRPEVRACMPLVMECWPRHAEKSVESCISCCDASRGRSGWSECFDAKWTFEKCCNRNATHESERHGDGQFLLLGGHLPMDKRSPLTGRISRLASDASCLDALHSHMYPGRQTAHQAVPRMVHHDQCKGRLLSSAVERLAQSGT